MESVAYASGSTGVPAGHARPWGVRRSGSSCAGLLGVVCASGGRTAAGACVELVLEDDGGGLAIHTGPVGVALGPARRTAGSSPFHGSESGLGEVAGQPLVAECYRKTDPDRQRLAPGAGEWSPADPRHRTRRAASRRRARRSVRGRGPRQARGVLLERSGRAGASRAAARSRPPRPVGDGQPDALLPEIDRRASGSRRRGHRTAPASRWTEWPIVSVDATLEARDRARPVGRHVDLDLAVRLEDGLASVDRLAEDHRLELGRVEDRDLVGGDGDREADRLADDDRVADIDLDRAFDELVAGVDRWLDGGSAMAVTGAECRRRRRSPSRTGRGRTTVTSWPTSVSGATVGVDWPRTPVAGKTVEPAGALAGSAIASRNASWSDEFERGHRAVHVLLGHPRELRRSDRRSSGRGW